MKRSCQRHTTVLPLPTARVMAVVPLPSAVRTMIRARHTCFCGLLRSRMIDCKRTRSAGVTLMEIPLHITNRRTNPNVQNLLSDSSARCGPLGVSHPSNLIVSLHQHEAPDIRAGGCHCAHSAPVA